MRSLRARLLAASLTVALLAVGVTAWAVNRSTSSEVRRAVASDLEVEELIYEDLSFFAFATGSWDGVEEVVDDLAAVYDERIALTTVDGAVIADSDPGAALPDTPVRFVDPDNPVISFDEPPPFAIEDFADLSGQVDELTFALEEAGVPFEVVEGFGIELPVWDPEDPLAGPVVGRFLIEGGLGGTMGDTDLILLLEELGIPFEEIQGPDGSLEIAWSLADPLLIESVIGTGEFGFGPMQFTAEPALLFLGAGEADRVLPDPIGWQLILIVAGVAAAAVAATVLVSRRVVGPVAALTAAARRMGEGDLRERVPVGGDDEISALAGAFNAMADSLETQDRLRKTMTGDIAHELRTPLSNIRGYLEALEEGVIDPTPEMITSIREEAVLLQRLVDELQDLALAEGDALQIDLRPTDLGGLIDQAVAAARPAAVTAGIDLVFGGAPELIHSVDPDRIRQVVGNLLQNAVRHTPDGGTVTVTLRSGEASDQIIVTDTGEGIDPEHLPHVFDRFYRADPSRSRETGGTGLGLAIAAELVRLHGGTITVDSEPRRGSAFTVDLPRDSGTT